MSSDGQPAPLGVENGFNAASDGAASDGAASDGAASDGAASGCATIDGVTRDNAASSSSKPRWQLNLKALFLIVALAGPALGFGGPPVYRHVREWFAPSEYPVSNTPQLIEKQIQKSREYMELFQNQRSIPNAQPAGDPAGAATGVPVQVAGPADR